MTNNPVLLIITPSNLRLSEIKMEIKTTKIEDIVPILYEQRTTFILLDQSDKTNNCLSTPEMFIANIRTGGFTLEVINKRSR
ncbi:unnamed protein product [Rotaria sp. Silwood2]|nr:unnamed protein product [Rotaria sp. Silwood2]CAF3212942.1 unnamed protein product [Rotaria sp. Silwood2]CAF4373983.1 unnamed protein product [Rotaria sp. Silwood2]CAF4509600.1 unnamed protein product [Rotaria sp. Silwood2]CAF4529894.1 unnamed protein product [Rotaria sp. Silwood2]